MTEVIEKQSVLLAKIIDDILEIADADTLNPVAEKFQLDAMIEENVAMARQVTAPGVQLEYKPEKVDCTVNTDRNMLSRVLSKVLDNAAKFTAEGNIVVSTNYADDKFSIIVEDTGCGIPEDKAGVVFEQFTKLDEFSQGTGMGLTLARAFMDKLGGRIFVDTSYSGKGARFVIEIPSV